MVMEEIYLYKPDVQVCRYVFYIDQICKQCVHIREKSVLLEADGRSHSEINRNCSNLYAGKQSEEMTNLG